VPIGVGREIRKAYALVDWHNVQERVAPRFQSHPRKHLPDAILKIQQRIADVLSGTGSAKHRVTLRIYHGWHAQRVPTSIRRDFEPLENDTSLARRFSNVSFTPGFQFGNELSCHDGSTPLYATYRGSGQDMGQKMVDSAIVCDLLHLLRIGHADCCIIVSDDDDYIPAILTAKAWAMSAILLRRRGNDIKHVTDVDCSRELAYWSNE
jgi:hypothetical protein